jgi:hypothetical protein
MQSIMIYGSETWSMKVEDMNRLERALENDDEIDVKHVIER